jgi:hypothetical protein
MISSVRDSCWNCLRCWNRELKKFFRPEPPLTRGAADRGRFFSSVEMADGEDMIQTVIDYMGPGVLTYASDLLIWSAASQARWITS